MNTAIKIKKYITAFCNGMYVTYLIIKVFLGAPARSRTQNLLVRSQALYPIELQAPIDFLSKYVCYLKSLSMQYYVLINFFLMIRRPPRSTRKESSAASDVYKRQQLDRAPDFGSGGSGFDS